MSICITLLLVWYHARAAQQASKLLTLFARKNSVRSRSCKGTSLQQCMGFESTYYAVVALMVGEHNQGMSDVGAPPDGAASQVCGQRPIKKGPVRTIVSTVQPIMTKHRSCSAEIAHVYTHRHRGGAKHPGAQAGCDDVQWHVQEYDTNVETVKVE